MLQEWHSRKGVGACAPHNCSDDHLVKLLQSFIAASLARNFYDDFGNPVASLLVDLVGTGFFGSLKFPPDVFLQPPGEVSDAECVSAVSVSGTH